MIVKRWLACTLAPLATKLKSCFLFVPVNREFKQRRLWANHVNRRWIFAHLSCYFEQTFGQVFSIRVKTISNTILLAPWHIKRGKSSLPVDERRSKTLLLKLPYSEFVQNNSSSVQNIHLRLTCVAHKRRCLNSLLTETNKKWPREGKM